jgi:uncharacterized membrane protein YbhN (UPF0104 family)
VGTLAAEPVEATPHLRPAAPPVSLFGRLTQFGRRRRTALTVVGSLLTAALLVLLLVGRGEEFATALSGVAAWVIALTVLLQIVALVSRSEAWHLTIEAAGGDVDRRVLYRASSMQVLGSVINGQLGVAARIAALRRSSPDSCPGVPTLVAAEFPILAVEGMLAALASFTLVAPLGLPWWLPIAAFAVVGLASAGLRRLALQKGRELWRGLAVLRSLRGWTRVIGLVLVAVFAQILRNWLLLQAVGVDASLFDAAAVLIAVVTLGQLPVGPSVGAAAAVLILGSEGVAAAAAAGLLLTATGTLGGLLFAGWAGADHLWCAARRRRLPRVRRAAPRRRSAQRAGPRLRHRRSHSSLVNGDEQGAASSDEQSARVRAAHERAARTHQCAYLLDRNAAELLERRGDVDAAHRYRETAEHHARLAEEDRRLALVPP